MSIETIECGYKPFGCNVVLLKHTTITYDISYSNTFEFGHG